MDSKRQQIIDAIIAQMRLIKTAGGYQTNLGDNVADFETNFDDEDLPALSVCDLVESNAVNNNQPTASMQTNTLPVQLRIFCKSGTRARELRKMIADVNKAISADPRWSKLAMWTLPKQQGIILSDEAFRIGGAAVEIEIAYMTNTFNSYE